MLDVHPAHHAATTWKEFLIHIATIVLGLLIAIGLEQTVEHFHNRREVAKVRRELQGERDGNKENVKAETLNWRWETAELQNNLLVLAYLQQHPRTPPDKLPGALIWYHQSAAHNQAVWDAAKASNVTTLMDRDEVENYEFLYRQLSSIDESRALAFDGMNDASRYELTDSDLSHLTPAQIADITTLTQIALTRQWLEGVALENTSRIFKDFPHTVTSAELSHIHNQKTLTEAMKDPAFNVSITRMKAAGFVP
jgi:hypothetical protein